MCSLEQSVTYYFEAYLKSTAAGGFITVTVSVFATECNFSVEVAYVCMYVHGVYIGKSLKSDRAAQHRA